jgi:hypothetical protein
MDLACSKHGKNETSRNKKKIVGTYRKGKVPERPRRRWEENTATNLKEVGFGDVE